jgi:hypothetical protein
MSPADIDDFALDDWRRRSRCGALILAADSNKPAPAPACKTDFSHRQDFDL